MQLTSFLKILYFNSFLGISTNQMRLPIKEHPHMNHILSSLRVTLLIKHGHNDKIVTFTHTTCQGSFQRKSSVEWLLIASYTTTLSLLGHANQLYLELCMKLLKYAESGHGTLIQQLSLATHCLLKLPAEVHQCIAMCWAKHGGSWTCMWRLEVLQKALQEHTLQQDSSVLLTSDGKLHRYP